MKLDILAFAAHPDDTELACSGTLYHHKSMGKKVGVVDLTQGQLGSRGTAELRLKEAEEAQSILGLDVRENLGFEDGMFSNDWDSKLAVIKMIRKYQPDVVLANAIEDRHPDHGRASKLVSEACFYSGLVKVETLDNNEKQDVWRPKTVLHYIQDRYIKPDLIVDISDYMDVKLKAIEAFSSQFYNPIKEVEDNEPQTPISSPEFITFIKSRAAEFGRLINAKFGEGFTTERTIGIDDLTNLK